MIVGFVQGSSRSLIDFNRPVRSMGRLPHRAHLMIAWYSVRLLPVLVLLGIVAEPGMFMECSICCGSCFMMEWQKMMYIARSLSLRFSVWTGCFISLQRTQRFKCNKLTFRSAENISTNQTTTLYTAKVASNDH